MSTTSNAIDNNLQPLTLDIVNHIDGDMRYTEKSEYILANAQYIKYQPSLLLTILSNCR